ncbi:MAG: universal stress protein, partial [Gemmatimonadales bacterium]
ADQVVRRSTIPCLLIPDGSWRDRPRILAAVDGTDRGAAVLRGAARVAELCRGSTRAVTVFEIPPIGGVSAVVDPMVGDRVRRILELRQDRGRRRVDAAPGPPVLVRHGEPVDEVLAEASGGIDVVAVGMRRLGQPDSRLERGVARQILRRATGAVLTIPL